MRDSLFVALAATLFAAAPSLAQQQPYAGLEARAGEGAIGRSRSHLVRRFAVLTGQHTHDLKRWQTWPVARGSERKEGIQEARGT